jgi:hypothetical protein
MFYASDDLAEGVYAASGTPAVADVTYKLKLNGGWDGNKNYVISFTNNSSRKLDSVTVTLKVNGNVTGIDGNVTGIVNGATATVTFDNYGNGFAPNSTSSDVYMHVTGTGNFSVE